MLMGLAVGVIISPPLIAQRSGGIDEIVCSKLTIVDKYGRTYAKSIDIMGKKQ